MIKRLNFETEFHQIPDPTTYILYVEVVLVLSCLIQPVPAPVPRCSPWIIINKLVEWNSLWSDNNPYFPIRPCEYGGPLQVRRAPGIDGGDSTIIMVFIVHCDETGQLVCLMYCLECSTTIANLTSLHIAIAHTVSHT